MRTELNLVFVKNINQSHPIYGQTSIIMFRKQKINNINNSNDPYILTLSPIPTLRREIIDSHFVPIPTLHRENSGIEPCQVGILTFPLQAKREFLLCAGTTPEFYPFLLCAEHIFDT